MLRIYLHSYSQLILALIHTLHSQLSTHTAPPHSHTTHTLNLELHDEMPNNAQYSDDQDRQCA